MPQFYGVDYEYLLGETTCQTKATQDGLKDEFDFALSLLPQDTQTAIVRSLNNISNAFSTIDVSGEEAECGKVFEDLLLFISSTMHLYASTREEAERLSGNLERLNDNTINRAQILEIQAHKFYVNALQSKKSAVKSMLDFIEKMDNTLYSDVMRPFEKEV